LDGDHGREKVATVVRYGGYIGQPPFVFLAFMIENFVEMSLSSMGLPSEVPGGTRWTLVGYAIFRAGPQPSRVQ
jgi:hypothetical protein